MMTTNSRRTTTGTDCPQSAKLLAESSPPRTRHALRRRGNVVVLTAMLMVMLFAMVAFAIDIGFILHARTELQRTADACAMAAVLWLPDLDKARSAAENTAVQNYGTVGPDLEGSDVEFGFWDRDMGLFTSPVPSGQTVNAVRVTVKRSSDRDNALQLFFAPLIGTSAADTTASATAAYDKNLCGPFVGIDWVSAPGSVVTDSYNSEEAPYNPLTARDRGGLCSDGPISVEGQGLIKGDARAGKGHQVTLTGSATVTGSRGSRQKPLNLPPVDASEAAVSNDNSDLPGIPEGNSYRSPIDGNRNFLLDGSKTYNIPPGTYYLNDFILQGQSVFNVSGPTTIYVTGKLERAGGVIVNNFTQKPKDLKILMTGSTANVTSYNAFYGVIYAPNTNVKLDGASNYLGAVVGKTVTITGSAQGHYDESLRLTDAELPRRISLVD